MVRMIAAVGFCVVFSLSGCASFPSWTQGKNKWGSNTAASTPHNSSPLLGSSDLTASDKPTNPIKLHLAYAAWNEQSGELSEARDSYLKVLQKNPKDVDAILGLARIDRAFGLKDEADQHLKKARKLHPKDPKVFVAMGHAHAAKREWDEAKDNMQTACKLAPYDSIYKYHLALVEAGSGDIPMALVHFKALVGDAEAHYNVGFILYEQGRTNEAEAQIVEALKLKPDLKQAQATLATIRSGIEDEVRPASFNQPNRR